MMGEIDTVINFMNSDKSKNFADVTSHSPEGRTCGRIVSKKSIIHYKALWAEHYKAVSGYFDGYGWFTDLEGEFSSKAAADEALENLKAAIQKADTREG